MEEDIVFAGLRIYIIVLVSVTAIAYLYFIFYTIKEGRKRDVLNFGLVILALLASPFITAAFVSLTKQDSDRIKIGYKNKKGELITSRLSQWKKLKLGISTIQKVEDINTHCRFCKTDFQSNELKCSNCGEKRIWYDLKIYDTSTKANKLIAIPDLINQKNDAIVFKQVCRKNTP